ncbi:ribonuclease HIII [Bacillus paranthracis]|uniref:ribonuclease HIII n=1 Tax=Bacillus paranthracis TaxID=2026186 RepID=UPI0021D3BFF3|nr:ribonuclease HIII [Bacillus paranthracis]MCU4904556.1 ribonuclease HIII [Bacillus paranthracis]
MITGKDKFEFFGNMKRVLELNGYIISNKKEINYGLQFQISRQNTSGLIRIFESKKGVRSDLSQIKNLNLLAEIQLLLEGQAGNTLEKVIENKKEELAIEFPDELIGTDESGKGDFFGPLVIAAVYVNKETRIRLEQLGVMDSKKLTDKVILELSQKIKGICPYSVVPIGNTKYNDLYTKIKNLNNLLAWGHARAIENILENIECQTVLSDQFGDEALIKKALFGKGKNVKLHQMHRAERNIAVAAASIIARSEYVNRLDQMSKKYKLEFPKGASVKTIVIGKEFVSQYGVDELKNVAKLHFKTTEQIKG